MSVASLDQLRWDLAFLADNQTVRSKRFGIPREAKSVRYPIRLLRYWFGYHLLREEAERQSRALDVAEIGVHTGQMLEFVRSAPVEVPLRKWTAVDTVMLWEKLRKAGYDDFFEANVEDPSFELPVDYDVAVLLHIDKFALVERSLAASRWSQRSLPGCESARSEGRQRRWGTLAFSLLLAFGEWQKRTDCDLNLLAAHFLSGARGAR